jgi:hypothetical protein
VHRPGGVPDAGGAAAEQGRRRLPRQHPVAEELLAPRVIHNHIPPLLWKAFGLSLKAWDGTERAGKWRLVQGQEGWELGSPTGRRDGIVLYI